MTLCSATSRVVSDLEVFTDTIYLSQTTKLRDGTTTKFLNLVDAIDAWKTSPDLRSFGTTRDGIAAALRVHKKSPVSDHLEIETYTSDVLPEHLKTGNITDYVTRELEWVRDELTTEPSTRS